MYARAAQLGPVPLLAEPDIMVHLVLSDDFGGRRRVPYFLWRVRSPDLDSASLVGGRLMRGLVFSDTGYRSVPEGPTCSVFDGQSTTSGFFEAQRPDRTVGTAETPSDIRTRLGPPHISFLPIAAGSVMPFIESLFPWLKLDHARLTSHLHCQPLDAGDIHWVLGSGKSIGIHWGTFTTAQNCVETRKAASKASAGDTCSKGVQLVDVGIWTGCGTQDIDGANEDGVGRVFNEGK